MSGFAVACSRTGDLGRALRYDMRLGCYAKEGKAELVASNVSVEDLWSATAEMRAVAGLRQDIKKPYLRFSVSSARGRLTRAEWSKLVRGTMMEVGLDPKEHPFIVHSHPGSAHDHIHCTVSRVGVSGRIAEGGWELLRLIRGIREASQRMGLRDAARTVDGDNFRLLRANRIRRRSGFSALSRRQIVEVLSGCLERTSSRAGFLDAAAGLGYELQLGTWPDGREKGLVLVIPGTSFRIALSHATGGVMSLRSIDARFDRPTHSGYAESRPGDAGRALVSRGDSESERAANEPAAAGSRLQDIVSESSLPVPGDEGCSTPDTPVSSLPESPGMPSTPDRDQPLVSAVTVDHLPMPTVSSDIEAFFSALLGAEGDIDDPGLSRVSLEDDAMATARAHPDRSPGSADAEPASSDRLAADRYGYARNATAKPWRPDSLQVAPSSPPGRPVGAVPDVEPTANPRWHEVTSAPAAAHSSSPLPALGHMPYDGATWEKTVDEVWPENADVADVADSSDDDEAPIEYVRPRG